MSKLLIYIGEGQKFELHRTISAIQSIPGILNGREGSFIGAVFECEYKRGGPGTIVRISPDLETVTAEGLGEESLQFALEFQGRWETPLRAIDMEYSFNIALQGVETVAHFQQEMGAGRGVGRRGA